MYTSSGFPSSTTFPLYITATLSEIYFTIDKSWAIKRSVRLRCFCKSFRRFTTCACMETSRAEIGSSHTRISGSTPKAIAIPILCLCPPENSCGNLLACSLLSPTISRRLYTFSILSFFELASL